MRPGVLVHECALGRHGDDSHNLTSVRSMREFLDWSTPLLPAAAKWLLRKCDTGDFGKFVVVVRGRSAGRRLLALLAAESQRAGQILVPPEFATPGNFHDRLFDTGGNAAGRVHRRLAWTAAVEQADRGTLQKLWRTPGAGTVELNARALAGVLDRTWQELGTSGANFRDALAIMERVSPDLAEFETDRWQALAAIEENYHRILESWEMRDPSELRRSLARNGIPRIEVHVVLVGIVELAPALVQVLGRLPDKPSVLIHAPESMSPGFDEWGRLDPAFWADRPCAFTQGEIHVVRGATEQAARCAEVIHAWGKSGLPPASIAIAAPEADSIPAILDGMDDRGIPARAAEGQSASRTALMELLSAVADYLDRAAGEPPLYSAIARLVRHPDLAPLLGNSISRLDRYFEDHLPWRMARPRDNEVEGASRLFDLLDGIAGLTEARTEKFPDGITALLLRVYGKRRLNRNTPEGRPLIHALESVCSALDELKAIPPNALKRRRSAELLRLVIEIAGSAEIPGQEKPDAVEVMGWLEAAADDSPGMVITSVFEGALPEGAGADPMLPDLLRSHLGLPCRASRYARDQHTLWTVRESRRKSGRIALVAPRRDAAGVPVRPSRLLVAASEGNELAARLLRLTTLPDSLRQPAHSGPGFLPPVPEPDLAKRLLVFPVTSFGVYLASPRLFHLKFVLGLRDRGDSSDEMDGGAFGTVMHTILGKFGERWLGRKATPSADAIHDELRTLLHECIAADFGPDSVPSVRCQVQALRERLWTFAERQADLFAQGWRIMYVEKREPLQLPFPVPGEPDGVELRGKIDRIDQHPEHGWRVVDYKTGSKAQMPLAAHYGARSMQWRDLQLPLYLHLLPAVGEIEGTRIDVERTDLVYFNLPPDSRNAGITEPFPRERCDEARQLAAEIIRKVRSGTGCEDMGTVHEMEDPAFLALCGLNGFPTLGEEEE